MLLHVSVSSILPIVLPTSNHTCLCLCRTVYISIFVIFVITHFSIYYISINHCIYTLRSLYPYLYLYLYISLSIDLSICTSVCLSVYLFTV